MLRKSRKEDINNEQPKQKRKRKRKTLDALPAPMESRLNFNFPPVPDGESKTVS